MARKKTNKTVVKSVQKNLNKDLVYKERIKKVQKKHTAEEVPLLINPIDTPDNPLTRDRLMDWLASTGWVYGYVRKRISPMNAHLYEDYSQSVWQSILEVKPEKIMDVWYTGKGKFVNYIKRIIDIQLKSTSCLNYNTNQRFHNTHCLLTDDQWTSFEEGGTDSYMTDSFPVKYNCPTGNKAKMIRVEHDEQPIHVDPDFCMFDTVTIIDNENHE